MSGAARPGSPAAPARCCDTGRPIFQDPITGQTVCSCQYELLNYQRLASGVPLSMYSAPYPDAAAAAGMAAYFPALAADQPPFYANTVRRHFLCLHLFYIPAAPSRLPHSLTKYFLSLLVPICSSSKSRNRQNVVLNWRITLYLLLNDTYNLLAHFHLSGKTRP